MGRVEVLRRACFSLLVALLLVGIGSSIASDWPMFHRDGVHKGWTTDSAPEEADTLWTYPLPKPNGWAEYKPVIWASPVYASGRVFVAARTGSLYCFDDEDRSVVWVVDVGDTLSSTPTVSSTGRVYVLGGADDRRVHAYNASTGTEVWTSCTLGDAGSWAIPSSRRDDAWVESSPNVIASEDNVVVDSVVYVGSGDGYLYALDAMTSNTPPTWRTKLGRYITSSPAVSGDRIFVGATLGQDSCGVFCLDTSDGDTLWHWTDEGHNDGGVMSSPTVVGDSLYIGTNWNGDPDPIGGSVCKFRTNYEGEGHSSSSHQRAEPDEFFGIQCDVRGTPTFFNGNVYASSGRGLFILSGYDLEPLVEEVKPSNNRETWSSMTISAVGFGAGSDTIVFVGDGGTGTPGNATKVWALTHVMVENTITDLDTLWYYDTGSLVWPSVAISAGRVYACSNGGTVYCFKQQQRGDGMPGAPDITRTTLNGNERLQLRLAASEPNPFSHGTRITYILGSNRFNPVGLRVFDTSGRLVRTLVDASQRAGTYTIAWDGTDEAGSPVQPGMYFYRLEAGLCSQTRRALLIR